MTAKLNFALLLFAASLAACGGGDQPAEPAAPAVAPADLVLRGGKVATVDPVLGNVEAIAVNGYQVTAVGTDDEIAALIQGAGPLPEVPEEDLARITAAAREEWQRDWVRPRNRRRAATAGTGSPSPPGSSTSSSPRRGC